MRSQSELALLEAYKRARAPAPEHLEATLQSVVTRAEAGEVVATGSGAGTTHVFLQVVAGAITGAVLVAAIVLGRGSPPAAPAATEGIVVETVDVQDGPVVPTVIETPPIPDEAALPTSVPDRAVAPPVSKKPRPVRPKSAAKKQEEPAVDPGLAELQIITRARRALRKGDHAGALRLLERHAREFPAGTLAHERNASRLKALCALGERARAAKLGREFAAASPASGLARQWREGCPTDG